MATDFANITISGIEIGTERVKVIVGSVADDDTVTVLGVGSAPSLKVRKGEALDQAIVAEQVAGAVIEAEQSAGRDLGENVFLAVTGAHCRSFNSVGVTLVSAPDHQVTDTDVQAAASQAKECRLPADSLPIHAEERFFQVDKGAPLLNPLGHVGGSLEANVHIIYAGRASLETAQAIVGSVLAGGAAETVFSGIAAVHGVCSRAEMDAGCLVIDIGAGMTEYAYFKDMVCQHSGQLAVGCEHAANDLAIGLQLPVSKSRRLLRDFASIGSVVMLPDGRSRIVEMEHLGKTPRRIPASTIERVVEMRFQELFRLILRDLASRELPELFRAGALLAGGGALLPGIELLATRELGMPVRIAKPCPLDGPAAHLADSPAFAVPVGLLRVGRQILERDQPPAEPVLQEFLQDVRKVGALVRRMMSK